MPNRHDPRDRRYDRYGALNPGNEPPLSVDGDEAPDRRKVSIRWLTGTVLTGLFGATLMGGAVYAALDGQYSFALAPTTAGGDGTELDSQSNINSKADRIILQQISDQPRQIIMLPVTTRLPDGKEEIRQRPFVRVLASLIMTPGDLAASVPAYNALKLASESTGDAPPPPTPDEPPPAAENDQVTMTTRPITEVPVRPDAGMTLTIEQVRSLARELAFEADARALELPTMIPQLGGFAAPASAGVGPIASLDTPTPFADPNSRIDITIVEENVTSVAKTAAVTRTREERVVVKDKQSLGDLLGGFGATPGEITAIAKALGDAAELHEGQRLRLMVEQVTEEGGRLRPVRLSINNADQHVATIALADSGDYVSVADPDRIGETDVMDEENGSGQRLYYAIYETALKQQVPPEMVEKLMRIYAYDVDLTRRTRAGDSFEIFYQEEIGKPRSDILYTALNIGNELKRYYRFSHEDGEVDYYDDDGKSARKFLLRKPINGGDMRSPFGYRRHPILGYTKLHTGVDWSDKVGTPIVATGNGTIVKTGWSNGYGRHTEIQHANGYLSTYSHMLAFAKGNEVGAKVVMGQVIGYLGSSGLSTGPHIHYEVKINGNFVNPMTIRLPQGKELGAGELAGFKEERDRIDAMMNKAPVAPQAAAAAPSRT